MKTPSFVRWVGAAVLPALVLASCAVHDPEVAGARDQFLKTRKTYLTGAAIGTAAGAVSGAGIGYLADGRDGARSGALIGGAIGLVGGLVHAHHVVEQRRAYSDAAAHLGDCTRVAEEQRANARNYNRTLDRRISEVRRDDAMVRGTIQDSNKVRSRLQEEIRLQEQALAQARREGVGRVKAQNQQAKINALKAEENRLDAHIERLSAESGEPALGTTE